MNEPTKEDLDKGHEVYIAEGGTNEEMFVLIAQAVADARAAGYQEAVAAYNHWADGCTGCATCAKWESAVDAGPDSRFPDA